MEKQHLQYITNAGNPTPAQFDDDWEPIGPMLRRDMQTAGLIEVRDGRMYLTEAGQAAAA
jgi:hypothetical protein